MGDAKRVDLDTLRVMRDRAPLGSSALEVLNDAIREIEAARSASRSSYAEASGLPLGSPLAIALSIAEDAVATVVNALAALHAQPSRKSRLVAYRCAVLPRLIARTDLAPVDVTPHEANDARARRVAYATDPDLRAALRALGDALRAIGRAWYGDDRVPVVLSPPEAP